MSSIVYIPESIKEIKQSIARFRTSLADWQAMLNKSRKSHLISYRAAQVETVKRQIAELQNALAIAIEEKKHQEAVDFVAYLATVRTDWDNGLFD